MHLAILKSRANLGMNAPLVNVEVHLSAGIPRLSIVGLPETAVKESKDRVRSAIMNSRFEFPAMRITVNLAPADLPKEGGRFDLPIALGILIASEQLNAEHIEEYEFAGELALSGELRPIQGILPFAYATQLAGCKLIIPQANADEAALIQNKQIFYAHHLLEVYDHLHHHQLLNTVICTEKKHQKTDEIDFAEVIGQINAKRAMVIAAAGHHHLLMNGVPGAGKSMLAQRFISLLPDLNEEQALETAMVHSLTQEGFDPAQWGKRPFRAPHHSASVPALVGGGNPPRPGEISRAHHGVLFLDELPEFNQKVLESLREPIETKRIIISRALHQAEFPARFQLIAAMNPCPCGYFNHPKITCRCSEIRIQNYRHRLSGPFLDRIDLYLNITQPELSWHHHSLSPQLNSTTMKNQVLEAQAIQYQRANKLNADLGANEIKEYCQLDNELQQLLSTNMYKFNFSMRACHRILKVARTIADISRHQKIDQSDLLEALSYRPSF